MKRKRIGIWVFSVAVGVAFLSLLYLQARYIDMMLGLRREQFDQAVFRSLDRVSRVMERRETFAYLRQVAQEQGWEVDSLSSFQPLVQDSMPFRLQKMHFDTSTRKGGFVMRSRTAISDATNQMREAVRNAYLYQQEVLDEVVFRILYSAAGRNFEDRVDFAALEVEMASAFKSNGIDQTFHFVVSASDGREVYRCNDYDSRGSDYGYQQTLFRSDPPEKMGMVRVHFPDMREYLWSSVEVLLPAMGFTVLLFLTFILTVYLNFRRRQVAELRNDFVHNMTHEFKTPLSGISLAAQMLADKSVPKTEAMYERLSGTIVRETKRLRMQVDKVLQMSLFDNGGINLNPKELDVHNIVNGVMENLSIKMHQIGGTIETRLDAEMSMLYADEMHITNVIYNLLDNAVKYRRQDVPLQLEIATWNPSKKTLCISIRDNGIGIRREQVKHIFERFYRVSTGDKHDVKGFGLGLAYVKAIIEQHKGHIKCESQIGEGTTFTITMPTT